MLAALKTKKFPRSVRKIRPRARARATLRLLKTLPPFRRHPLVAIKDFQPKQLIRVETENFILKTAETQFELREVLKLRHEIFYEELQGKSHENRVDVDEFDQLCDHLVIIDKKNFRVVGTYRVISSLYSQKFYSEGEFQIGEFLAQPGNKLELGRACIHKDFRTGAVIQLLWKGICEYIKRTDTKFLFGCASVQTVDPWVAGLILQYLKREGLSKDDFHVSPTEKYTLALPEPEITTNVEELIPPLVHSYVKAGAKFHGAPAWDADFNCFDYFMVLNVDEMSRLFKRRFGLS